MWQTTQHYAVNLSWALLSPPKIRAKIVSGDFKSLAREAKLFVFISFSLLSLIGSFLFFIPDIAPPKNPLEIAAIEFFTNGFKIFGIFLLGSAIWWPSQRMKVIHVPFNHFILTLSYFIAGPFLAIQFLVIIVLRYIPTDFADSLFPYIGSIENILLPLIYLAYVSYLLLYFNPYLINRIGVSRFLFVLQLLLLILAYNLLIDPISRGKNPIAEARKALDKNQIAEQTIRSKLTFGMMTNLQKEVSESFWHAFTHHGCSISFEQFDENGERQSWSVQLTICE
jgi:hypothetical protein